MQFLENYIVHSYKKFNEAQVRETEENEIKMHFIIKLLKTRNKAAAKLLQSCPTLCHPTDGSPPGSAVPGILQARALEWVATSFSSA